MSRVYDALRRAEQEQQGAVAGEADDLALPVHDGLVASAAAAPARAPQPRMAPVIEDAPSALAGCPVLSLVYASEQLVSGATTAGAAAERFRALATRIRLKSTSKPFQSIVVTSSISGEGKS